MSEPSANPASPGDPLPPAVSDYDLIRLIGQGGFGQVWLAANRATGHLRAVKVIASHRSGTTQPSEGHWDVPPNGRAGREITSIARLEANLRRQHPNLLNIHHVGMTEEHLFYVMDLADDVSGSPGSAEPDYRPATLQSRLADGPLPPQTCWRYARELLSGLAFLHESGMVHRDVKPANCLLVAGELKLADFGLLAEANPQISRVGTAKYMPPDGHMDARADVYAAGLVIYEMTTGLPADSFPRPGENALEAVNTPILGALSRLALRACDPDPQKRFRDAREMLAELEVARPEATAGRARSRRRICVALAGILLAGILVAAGVSGAAWWFWRPQPVYVNFVTYPFEATIYLDDQLQLDPNGDPCRTPVTIEDLPPGVHRVVFKHETLGALDAGPRDFSKQRRIEASWNSLPRAVGLPPR